MYVAVKWSKDEQLQLCLVMNEVKSVFQELKDNSCCMVEVAGALQLYEVGRDLHHCDQCEESCQMISILLYVSFWPEIVKKAWIMDRDFYQIWPLQCFSQTPTNYISIESSLYADYNGASISFIRLTTAVINQ